jgi:hypothetical protein
MENNSIIERAKYYLEILAISVQEHDLDLDELIAWAAEYFDLFHEEDWPRNFERLPPTLDLFWTLEQVVHAAKLLGVSARELVKMTAKAPEAQAQ